LKRSHPKKTIKATLLQFNEETPTMPFSFSGDRVKLSFKGRNIGFEEFLVTKGGTDKQLPAVGTLLVGKILTTDYLKSCERDLPDDIFKPLKQMLEDQMDHHPSLGQLAYQDQASKTLACLLC